VKTERGAFVDIFVIMNALWVLSTFFEKRDNVFCRIDGKIANGEIGDSSQRISLVPI